MQIKMQIDKNMNLLKLHKTHNYTCQWTVNNKSFKNHNTIYSNCSQYTFKTKNTIIVFLLSVQTTDISDGLEIKLN